MAYKKPDAGSLLLWGIVAAAVLAFVFGCPDAGWIGGVP
jgi:hypothetical protein